MQSNNIDQIYIDDLTGLNNERFLNEKYKEYLECYKNVNFVMIDFKNFKVINDTFGHAVGDDCLIQFAKVLKMYFEDALVIRLHGDEFVVVTHYSELKISNILQKCINQIAFLSLSKVIPVAFKFNAGSTRATEDIDETKEKADSMMYHAKAKGLTYKKFDKKIFERKLKQEKYVNLVDQFILNDNFSYSYRNFFYPNKEESGIIQIYTKNEDGSSIFGGEGYNILRGTSELIKFDSYNVKKLVNLNLPYKKIFISIDYKSLLNGTGFLKNFSYLKKTTNISFDDLILNINLNGISNIKYSVLLERILEFKNIGFQICLDKFDSNIGDILWENNNVDYIKFEKDYWKSAIHNNTLKNVLKYKILMFKEFNIKTIFDFIETKEEHDFLVSITNENVLLSGNYYSSEERYLSNND